MWKCEYCRGKLTGASNCPNCGAPDTGCESEWHVKYAEAVWQAQLDELHIALSPPIYGLIRPGKYLRVDDPKDESRDPCY